MLEHRSRKRTLSARRLLLCLVFGAVANVAVAYWILYRVEFHNYEYYWQELYPELESVRSFRRGRYPLPTSALGSAREGSIPTADEIEYYFIWGFGFSEFEWTAIAKGEPEIGRVYIGSRLGWPLPALREDRYHEYRWDAQSGTYEITHGASKDHESFAAGVEARSLPNWIVAGGISLTPDFPPNGDGDPKIVERDFVMRRVPFRPVLTGFAANSLIYAFAAYTLLFGIAAARGVIRRRRGLCPKCGYNRAGLTPATPCPECGTRPKATPGFTT